MICIRATCRISVLLPPILGPVITMQRGPDASNSTLTHPILDPSLNNKWVHQERGGHCAYSGRMPLCFLAMGASPFGYQVSLLRSDQASHNQEAPRHEQGNRCNRAKPALGRRPGDVDSLLRPWIDIGFRMGSGVASCHSYSSYTHLSIHRSRMGCIHEVAHLGQKGSPGKIRAGRKGFSLLLEPRKEP